MSQSSALQQIACPPPALSTAAACEVAAAYYGLQVNARPLVSERDQNFHLKADDGSQWVLKIANAAEDPAVTLFQVRALQHIAAKGSPELRVPELRLTRSGEEQVRLQADGREVFARLVSYVPGQLLDAENITIAFARNAGAGLARLAALLADFDFPAPRQALLWDMQQALKLRELLVHCHADDERPAVAACLDDFAEHALPQFADLRSQVIHNDLNPANMLVDSQQPDRLAGVIDFGDMQRAPLVMDIGVAAAYLRNASGDPLDLMKAFVAGYNSVTALTAQELGLIFDLVNTRLATTVAILAWRRAERSADDAYLGAASSQEQSALPFLQRLRAVTRNEASTAFRAACRDAY